MPERLRSGLRLRRLVDVVIDVGRISTRSFVILGSIRKPSTIITLEPDVKTKQIPRLRPTSPACCTRTTRLRTFSPSTSRACGCRTSGQLPCFGLQSCPVPRAPRASSAHQPLAPASRAWPRVLARARQAASLAEEVGTHAVCLSAENNEGKAWMTMACVLEQPSESSGAPF